MRHRFVVALLLLTVTILPVASQNGMTITREIAYVEDGHPAQTLDIYLPDATFAAPYPVMMLVHGGGFFFGDKSSVEPIARRYVEAGYAVIAPGYRLYPDARFPDSQADVFCAMAWTFAHANQYNLNTDEIVLFGESAGGNITAYLGAVDDATDFMTDCPYEYPENPDYDAVISLYMPVDLLSCECTIARRMASLYTGISYFDWEDETAIAGNFDISIISWLDENDPPFYLIHGDIDFLVPVSESLLFTDAVDAAGGESELVIFEGANHGFMTGAPDSDLLERGFEVIDGWLGLS